jgi:hypothetical protein
MSWTQGVQLRGDMAESWVARLDSYTDVGKVASLVWDLTEPELLHAMYEDEKGYVVKTITFKVRRTHS